MPSRSTLVAPDRLGAGEFDVEARVHALDAAGVGERPTATGSCSGPSGMPNTSSFVRQKNSSSSSPNAAVRGADRGEPLAHRAGHERRCVTFSPTIVNRTPLRTTRSSASGSTMALNSAYGRRVAALGRAAHPDDLADAAGELGPVAQQDRDVRDRPRGDDRHGLVEPRRARRP